MTSFLREYQIPENQDFNITRDVGNKKLYCWQKLIWEHWEIQFEFKEETSYIDTECQHNNLPIGYSGRSCQKSAKKKKKLSAFLYALFFFFSN